MNEGKELYNGLSNEHYHSHFVILAKFYSMAKYQVTLFSIMPSPGKRRNYSDMENL